MGGRLSVAASSVSVFPMARLLVLCQLCLLVAWTSAVSEDLRRVVLVEKHGFTKGTSVDISIVDAPGIQKLLAVVCRDSTLSKCQGFALDGKSIHPMLREPLHYSPDDVFEAFFGGPYISRLFGPDASGRVLKPLFNLKHLEDGSFEFTYDYKDIGKQKSAIRPKPKNLGFDYLFIGAEVKIGVSDPVGTVTSF